MVERKRKMDIIIIGDSQVGKTSLLNKISGRQVNKAAIATIGVDSVNLKHDPKDGGGEVIVKLWDTAGQDRFRNLTYQLYRQADGLLLVMDKTNTDSINGCKQWM